jgi:hypothetical protein
MKSTPELKVQLVRAAESAKGFDSLGGLIPPHNPIEKRGVTDEVRASSFPWARALARNFNMSITYFVPGTKPECRVLTGLSAVIVELAGGYPSTQWDLGSFPPEAIEKAAGALENLPDASPFLPEKGLVVSGGTAQIRGNGQMLYWLGRFSHEDAKAYLKAKARKLREVAAAARAAGTLVSYG